MLLAGCLVWWSLVVVVGHLLDELVGWSMCMTVRSIGVLISGSIPNAVIEQDNML